MFWAASLSCGAFMFLFGAVVDWLVFGRLGHPLTALVISDALSGFLAFGLAALLFHHERVKEQQMKKRLAVLDDVNDQVRNTLQGIAFSIGRLENTREAGELQEAVDRIRRVLTDVLPHVEPTYRPFEGSAREAGLSARM